MLRTTLALVAALALTTSCSKKQEAATDKAGSAAAATASGLAWEPVGYDKLTAGCKKDLACCEAILKAEKGSPTAEDYNGACSGPALWQEADCNVDLKSRLASDKPVPDACK